jgi:hypothetical protein
MRQRTFVIGEKPSPANVVKLSGNFLIGSMIESLGEAFALIRKSGVDPHRYLEILTRRRRRLGGRERKAKILQSQFHCEPGRLVFLVDDEPAIGLVDRRREPGSSRQASASAIISSPASRRGKATRTGRASLGSSPATRGYNGSGGASAPCRTA